MALSSCFIMPPPFMVHPQIIWEQGHTSPAHPTLGIFQAPVFGFPTIPWASLSQTSILSGRSMFIPDCLDSMLEGIHWSNNPTVLSSPDLLLTRPTELIQGCGCPLSVDNTHWLPIPGWLLLTQVKVTADSLAMDVAGGDLPIFGSLSPGTQSAGYASTPEGAVWLCGESSFRGVSGRPLDWVNHMPRTVPSVVKLALDFYHSDYNVFLSGGWECAWRRGWYKDMIS